MSAWFLVLHHGNNYFCSGVAVVVIVIIGHILIVAVGGPDTSQAFIHDFCPSNNSVCYVGNPPIADEETELKEDESFPRTVTELANCEIVRSQSLLFSQTLYVSSSSGSHINTLTSFISSKILAQC